MTVTNSVVKERVNALGIENIDSIEMQKINDYTIRAIMKAKEGEKVKKVYITDTPYEQIANEFKMAAEEELNTAVAVEIPKKKRAKRNRKVKI